MLDWEERENSSTTTAPLPSSSTPTFAKSLFALFFEYEGNVDTGTRFDFVVAVHEVQVQHAGKLPADGRLACAHRADEKYVLRFFHIEIKRKPTRGLAFVIILLVKA